MTRPEPLPVPPSEAEEQEVIDFLRKNPDFFSRHDQILADLPVRHGAGAAVSLIERQVNVLRKNNRRLNERLEQLLEAARANEQRVNGMNHLAQNLIQADSLASTITGLSESLHREFSVDAVCLGVLDAVDTDIAQPPCRLLVRDQLPGELDDFFRQGKIVCGPLSQAVSDCLFPEHPELNSAALVPLDRGDPLGLLALASTDPQQFTGGMGAMFLEMTAKLCTAALRFHGLGQR